MNRWKNYHPPYPKKEFKDRARYLRGECSACKKPLIQKRANRCSDCYHQSRKIPLEVAFLKRVTKTDGCWLWLGKRYPSGYGSFRGKGAHRISWEIHFGEIPSAKIVCHECDNPPCVNPSHLWLGNHQDNARDKVLKNRHRIGEKHPMAKLTIKDVKKIRKLYGQEAMTQNGIASQFGVTREAVSQIIRRVIWKHVI